MSHDAVMRWEWEGGTPASINERGEAASAEPAATVRIPPQPNRNASGRPATSSPVPTERRQSDSRER
jgi:hypothetical protein